MGEPGVRAAGKTNARHSVSSQLMKYNIIGATILMTFRMQIHKKNSVKMVFVINRGTMSHRPLTNTSSLKSTAAYWRYSQSCWYFWPNFVNCCLPPLLSCSTLPLYPPPFPVWISIPLQCGVGYGVLGLGQISTCHKVPLKVNFLDDNILHCLLWVLSFYTFIYRSQTRALLNSPNRRHLFVTPPPRTPSSFHI